VMPATHWQPPRQLRGPPRVRFGATRPVQRQRDPFDAAALSQRIDQLAKETRQATAATPSPETSTAAGTPAAAGATTSVTPPSEPEFQPPASNEAEGD